MNEPISTKNSFNQKGCLLIGLFGFSIVWLVGATIASQLMMWLMEQTLFEATFLFPDLRWLIILSYVILVGLPLIMIRFIVNDQFINKIYQFWLTINFLGILILPARFLAINDAFKVSLFQLFGISIYLTFLLIIYKRRNLSIYWKVKPELIWIPVSIAGLYFIPWVLWGALGSALDLILNSMVGVLSGFLLTICIQQLFIDLFPEDEKIPPERKIFFGFIVLIGLIIFSTVFGLNGQQWLLVFTIPFSSWIISGLFKNVGGEQSIFNSVWLLLTTIITAPLIWFDPDELSLLIGSESGEIFTWVSQVISYAVIILLFATVLTGFLRKKVDEGKIKKPLMVFSLLIWVVVIIIYALVGQPGLHGESLFVIMKDQVNLSEVNAIIDPIQKRDYVYLNSTDFAAKSQANLTSFLTQFRIEYQPYYLVNALEVNTGPFWKWIIEQRDDVDRVLQNPNLRPLPEEIPVKSGNETSVNEPLWSLDMIGVYQVWEDFNVYGSGIIIGQADSGVDGNHPALREQFVGAKYNTNYAWYDPWFETNFPQDISGHGTHTLGTILGKKVGIAPDAEWIGCVNLGRNLGNPAIYLSCMQFLFAPFPDDGDPLTEGKPELGAQILNNSWGCPEIEGCDALVFEQAVSALRSAGVFVVSSAGNNGYYGCESISDPLAIYEDVFTVGAIDKIGELSQFSSLGPVTVDDSGSIKPDLVAPGEDIFSSMPYASYAILSGTSMAGPHVVGTVALMWSANPELIGQISLTEKILFNTANHYEGMVPACVDSTSRPNNAVGFGVLNTYKAVEEALKIR